MVGQASASASNGLDFQQAVMNATRRVVDGQAVRGSREPRSIQLQNGDAARSRQANRILRLESRHGIDTAASINTMRVQRAVRLNSLDLNGLPTDLNLNSRRDNYTISGLGNVTITRNGSAVVVNADSKLTAAEVAAVYQVLGDGAQALSLGKKGNADGGSLSIDAAAANGLTGLVIPKNVTVTGDFTSAAELGISGDVRNAGNLFVRSGDPSLLAATISADNIRNSKTGNIATLDSGVGVLNLSLSANMDIVNHGRITSAGDVSLTTGGSILNTADGAGAVPTITAGRNVSLQSSNIVNQGIVSATTGNINLADQLANIPANKIIAVTAHGGSFNATNGDITVGSNGFDSSTALFLNGGDYHSNNLIVNAGAGSADGVVGDITGQLKVNAGIAHIGASTDNLNLGQCVIAGDPTFFNNAGDISINGDLVFNEAIAILASGNVTDDGNARLIQARNGDDGQNVTIIAGVTLTPQGNADPTDAIPGGEIGAGAVVAVRKTSKTGGNIDLSVSTIDVSGINTGSGGNVLLAANGTKKGDNGLVNVHTILASGNDGDNGDIQVFGSNNNQETITLDTVTTGVGQGTPGNVTLIAAPAVFTDFVVDSTGNYTGSVAAGKKLATGDIGTGTLTAFAGDVTITTGGAARLRNATVVSGFVGRDGGDLEVTAGRIFVMGNVSSYGGVGITDAVTNHGLDGGNGGDITLTATKGGIVVSPGLAVTSGGGDGGDGTLNVAYAGNGGAAGHGGNVSLNSAAGIEAGALSAVSSVGGIGGHGAAAAFESGHDGGLAGAGGDAGNVVLSTVNSDIVLDSFIISAGGGSGAGGSGSDSAAGNSGNGGDGAMGGAGGNITITTTGSGNIEFAGTIGSYAGFTAAAGKGGNGNNGGDGGHAMAGNSSGDILIQLDKGTLSFQDLAQISTVAGNGGKAGDGGNTFEGQGGQGGSASGGGTAGRIDISASLKGGGVDGLTTNLIRSVGGANGVSGNGGDATTVDGGGSGGNGGDVTEGGGAGTVSITAEVINFTGAISARTDSLAVSSAGRGGHGQDANAVSAGSGGHGGSYIRDTEEGGSGGSVNITGGFVNLNIVDVSGVAGGNGGGAGLAGGINSLGAGNGGNGGNGGDGATGESGGVIDILGASVNVVLLDARGAAGGSGASGAEGGFNDGPGFSGDGGLGGDAGLQGSGGLIFVSTSKGKPPTIEITTINASAGAQATAGSGGDAGSSGVMGAVQGNGGAAGATNFSGNGGVVEINSGGDVIVNNVTVAGGIGNAGGNGGSGIFAGTGSFINNGGSGGAIEVQSKKGLFTFGSIDISGGNGASGAMSGSSSENLFGTDGGRGGDGGELTLTTSGSTTFDTSLNGNGGSGGDGGSGPAAGGYGGNGGSGGRGGSVTVTGSSITANTNMLLSGGNGGAGGGGFVNFTGGTAATGGDGGNGGSLYLSNIKGDSQFSSVLIQGGNGGAGAAASVVINGTGDGSGAAGGAGGTGGDGGFVTTYKVSGNLAGNALRIDGGAGGVGGTGGGAITTPIPAFGPPGGVGGDGGAGGDAGDMTVVTGKKKTIEFVTGLTAQGGAGGDGGAGGSGGTGTNTFGAGGNGGDGGEGGAGGFITTSPAAANTNVEGGLGGDGGTGGSGVPDGEPGTDGEDGISGASDLEP